MSFSLVTKHSRFPHPADTIIPDEGSGKSKSLGMMVAAAAANFIKQEDVTRTNIVGLFTATESSADDQTGESLTYQDLLVGCCLAVAGNLLISISLNVQKYTHMRNAHVEMPQHYLHNPLWWFGLVMMGFGELGNFSAYGYAPASLVAPLGTTTVIANIFLAAVFLKEKIRPEHLFGSALAIVGACLLVIFASKKEHILDGDEITRAVTEPSFIVYISIEAVGLLTLFILLYKMQIEHVVVYLLITAISASFTVISAKAVSSMLHLSISGIPQFQYFMFYIMLTVMIITIVVQIKYLNLAMKNFNSTVVVPTNFVFFTISAIIAGIVFYKEFFGMSVLEICMFLFGCLLSFVGVYFVTGEKILGQSEDPQLMTDEEEKPIASTVPSWLMANMHQNPVQPKREPNPHLSDNERNLVQTFTSSSSSSDSFGSQDTLFEKHTKTAARHYGTNY